VGEPAPDRILRALQEGAGPAPLPPLRLADPAPSARRGAAGAAVGAARRAVLRLISPAMADLLAQLERDRHRHRAEVVRLEARIAALEAERGGSGAR
jgi:hypothetical protein